MVAVGVLGLEAGSLAAIATGAAVTGAAGAGIGAGIGAATGGDIGDAALMGGIGGLAAGAGAGMMGAGAAAGEGAAAGAATGAGEAAATGAGEAAATGAGMTTMEGGTTVMTGAGAGGNGLGGFAGLEGGTGLTGGGIGTQSGLQMGTQMSNAITPALNTATANIGLPAGMNIGGSGLQAAGALNSALPTASSFASQAPAPAYAGIAPSAAPELSYGQQAVQALTGAAPNSATVQYGGSALQGMATGAGVQGISNAVTGRPITEGMGTSAIAGGIGGAAATGLASQAGTGGALGAAGDFAKAHNIITPMGISMLASPMVDALANSGQDTTTPNQKGIKPDFRYDTAAYRRKSNPVMYAHGGDVMQPSGISTLGGYSDGGRLLKGPGDGVSDSIPAIIGNKEPARLAEGEFVIPARIVSELGNGSTDAGAKQLYAMMDRVQHARHKTMGKGKFSENTHAKNQLPA